MTSSVVSSPFLLEQYRQQFPSLVNKAYFNYGGQGPMPEGAMVAMHQSQEYIQRSGPFSEEVNHWITQEAQRLREAIALELHSPVTSISLTEDVTVGCNIPLWGFGWNAGDHLLLSDCEHPGIVAIAQELQHRFGIDVSFCPLMDTLNEGDPVEVIGRHLRPSTRMVVVSHILWNTGQVLPLQEIVSLCHTYPAEAGPVRVLVDAAQSVGVLPLDLTALEVDYYAFTGHKWWCGPAGIGGLYVRPESLDSIRPTFLGWRSVTRDRQGYPTGWHTDGRRFEVATSDFSLHTGLAAAIATHHTFGTGGDRLRRIRDLSSHLWERLRVLPGVRCLRTTPPDAGLVSFQLETGNHSSLVKALEGQGFLLRTLLDPDCVRACVHYFTSEEEIHQLLDAMRSLL